MLMKKKKQMIYILFLLLPLAYGYEEVCCVCIPLSHCMNGTLTKLGVEFVGQTDADVYESKRLYNVESCQRKYLTCCKVPGDSANCVPSKTNEVSKLSTRAWAGFVYSSNPFTVLSSAILITPKVLLTTAHSLQNYETKPLRISMGDEWIYKTFHRYKDMIVKSISVHPNYQNENRINDIALVFLEDLVADGAEYRPATVNGRMKMMDPSLCFITGVQQDNIIKVKTIRASLVPARKCRKTLNRVMPRAERLKFGCVVTTQEEEYLKMFDGGAVSCQLRKSNKEVVLGIITSNVVPEPPVQTAFTSITSHAKWLNQEINRQTGNQAILFRQKSRRKSKMIHFKKH